LDIIKLLFVIVGFVVTKLEGPINTYFNEDKEVSKLVFKFIFGFHLLSVFSLFVNIVQKPTNDTIF